MEAFGFIFSLVAGFLPIGLLLFVIVAVIGTRNDEDPAGERPAALYYNGVLLVTVFVVLFAAFAIVSSLLNLTLDKSTDDFFSAGGNHDSDWDFAVRALIAGLVMAGLYQVHDGRRRPRAWGPVGQRIRRTYLYAVSFIAILIAAISGIFALWSLWETLAPGVTGSGPRSEGLIGFISSAFLAAGASFLALAHLREAEPEAPALGRTATPVPAPPPPPSAPPAVDMETGPRKRAAKKATPVKKAAKRL